MSSLLNRSLADIHRQERRGGGRASPYSRDPSRSTSTSSSEGKWQHDLFEGNAGARAPGRVAEAAPSPKIRVEGLHYEVSEPELKELFERIGPVSRAFIKFDRSGRSTGVAIVQYERLQHAVAAKEEYDGANAKGQPISIYFEAMPPPRGPTAGGAGAGARGAAGVPPSGPRGKADLLSRLSGPDLATRLGGAKGGAPPANAPRGPSQPHSRPGPVRSISGSGAASRGGGRPQGGRGGGRGGGGAGGGGSGGGARRGAPPSATDLDKELEAFMQAPPSEELSKSIHAPKDAQGDVEMV